MKNRKLNRIAIAIILTGLVLPPLLTGSFLSLTPSIPPEEAAHLLRDFKKDDVILLDARPETEFNKFSLQDSVNLPFNGSSFAKSIPEKLLKEKKHILVICNSGISSAQAARKLRQMGFLNALNIRGGLDAWLASKSELVNKTVRTPHGSANGVSSVVFTLTEQISIFTAAFILKPLYQIISLLVVIMLWRRSDSDLAALRRAMLAFFIGENACALNYIFFNGQNLLMEFFHMYGMLVCFGLASYALMAFFDARVFNFSNKDKRCALLPLCAQCYKYNDIRCNLRLLFLFVIPATAVLAAMPLTAPIGSHFYIGKVFNSSVIFGHPVIYQVLEARFYPLAALVFFVVSFFTLLFQREAGFEGSKIFYAIGLGPLGFSLMRFLCYWGYKENPLWADVWEEITEFLFIAFVLWITLRVRAAQRSNKN